MGNLSLDLDNEWAYLKTHGDPEWASYPSYFDVAVPRILELLSRHGMRITFFIVGQDAALEKNHASLAQIAAAGHEIGNHSLRHDPWLHQYTEAELEAELSEAERHILAATGQKPVGFRGPGFSLSPTTLEVLARRGYAYDASTLPSFLGPIARAYYLATGNFDAEQRKRLEQLFGSWKEGFRPLNPYRWQLGDATLVEMPVTTFPLLRVPIHLSYVLYLATFSSWLARSYFSTAIGMCRLKGVEPSILLHPLDFLGGEDAPRMRFFPSMKLSAQEKIRTVDYCLGRLARGFRMVPVGEHAAAAASRSLPLVAHT
ncbi:MAG: polysaccharide deacetylase family protein [Burkholderiaceae bacterium]|nr:polysaccharide deacetylase family protein [Burkholderiaceae bacterium]MEB2317236.1 polysaccharide deacetylase family protein [Pseudomonadota bacterium]